MKQLLTLNIINLFAGGPNRGRFESVEMLENRGHLERLSFGASVNRSSEPNKSEVWIPLNQTEASALLI